MSEFCPVCGSPIASTNACPHCGFKLHEGTAQYKPLDTLAPDIPLAQSHMHTNAYLHAVNGPQRGAEYPLGKESLSLGRDPQCNIFLNDMTVSRRHAIISCTDGRYQISDCNSFNGLWVNNSLVEFALLKNGDKIQLGAFTLVYKED